MLIYKQRYKPRTSRAFTKSDLTVYDSASNTALNALTVYGKSEVVDGNIKSAGEGYAIVDLGTLTWTRNTDNEPYFYSVGINNRIKPTQNDQIANILIAKYTPTTSHALVNGTINNAIAINSSGTIQIRDTAYTDATNFATAMSGVLLCYELSDPTQGNCIAAKTDDGSGINGIMAVFETGTPLRGIPDTEARDTMQWNGNTGEAVTKCADIDMSMLTWERNTTSMPFPFFESQNIIDRLPGSRSILCGKYVTKPSRAYIDGDKQMCTYNTTTSRRIIVRDDGYTDTTAFAQSLAGVRLVYELETPTTQNLTSTENASIAGLRTFQPQTHAQNNAQTDMTVDYTIRVPTI